MFDLKTKVLIVDDMMTMRKIVAKACREIGFTDITDAADGALAWQKLSDNKENIGLVISDWNMPNCTGIDLLKRIRRDQRLGKMPFVLVTAEAEADQIVEAMKAGVSGYVVKPFNSETLKIQLEAVHSKLGK